MNNTKEENNNTDSPEVNNAFVIYNRIPVKIGIEIEELDTDSFLKLTETLRRIGKMSKDKKTVYQELHCLYKNDRYYIAHWKELPILDGKKIRNLYINDIVTRNHIIRLLEKWGIIKVKDREELSKTEVNHSSVVFLQYKNKDNYELKAKWEFKYKNDNSQFKKSQ